MNKKILPFLVSLSLALFLSACGDDSSSSSGLGIECLDNEDCLDEESSSSEEESSSSVKIKSSSSSVKGKSSASKDKSSSSVDEDESSSSKDKSSASKDKSSSSAKKDESSSSANKDKSSSSAKKDDSSSSKDKSSSSVVSSSSKGKSSSSVASSSSKPKSSSGESSSSSEPESSSSVQMKVTYLSDSPNAADLEVSGDTLFALFQRYTPDSRGYAEFNDNGLVALYKLSTGELLDTIPLLTKNPQAIKMVKGSLYVGTQGAYNSAGNIDADNERGIEKIDLKKKKSELWVSGAELGGGVYMMDVDYASGKAYATVYKSYGNAPVVEVDLASKAVKSVGKVTDGSGSLFFDQSKGVLYIGDRGFIDLDTYAMGDMGIRSYDGTTFTSLTSEEPYEFIYQPYSITVAGGELFVYISDYHSGALYWFEGGEFNDEERLQFSGDAKIVTANGKLYVLDREDKGSISNVDASKKTVTWQKALEGKNDNPYDLVAIDAGYAWVALYNTAEIIKISLSNGSKVSAIDTKEFCAKKLEPAE